MNKLKSSQILGGTMGWLDEIGFETETTASSVAKGVGGLLKDIASEVPGAVTDAFRNEPEYKLDPTKFPSSGSIEFTKMQEEAEQKEKAAAKRAFYQALKEDQQRAKEAKDKLLFEEEINDITTNLPTDEKNRLLHYQASYRDRSVYQRAELRKKIIEERKKADRKQVSITIPSPAKQAGALDTQFEGGAGTLGGGQANLKFGIG